MNACHACFSSPDSRDADLDQVLLFGDEKITMLP